MSRRYRFLASEMPWPAIDPGHMRHFITIRYFATTSPPTMDAAGVVRVPFTLLSSSAAIETLSGTDAIQAGQTTSRLDIAVGMWGEQPGCDRIVGGMQLVNGNNVYVIQEIEKLIGINVIFILKCLALGTNT